jgi:hypothetical protein
MHEIKNPEIVKLLKRFETMPEYIADKYRRYHEEKEFRRRVFEKACIEAGLLRPGRFPGFAKADVKPKE